MMAVGVAAGGLACREISLPVMAPEEFTATLTGAEEVPPVTTAASGTAVLGVFQDSILTYRVDVATIDSTTLSHIHEGAAGVAGPVILTVFTGPSGSSPCRNSLGDLINTASPRCRVGFSGPLGQAQLRPAQLTGLPAAYGATPRARFDSLVVLMRTGNVYVDVHNQANPSGHVRGQIHPR
jgi:hypothetical protein